VAEVDLVEDLRSFRGRRLGNLEANLVADGIGESMDDSDKFGKDGFDPCEAFGANPIRFGVLASELGHFGAEGGLSLNESRLRLSQSGVGLGQIRLALKEIRHRLFQAAVLLILRSSHVYPRTVLISL
jgi:hypothetical protein